LNCSDRHYITKRALKFKTCPANRSDINHKYMRPLCSTLSSVSATLVVQGTALMLIMSTQPAGNQISDSTLSYDFRHVANLE
ncbi:hypothetical protein BGZ76_003252, partial [Entomortierella beljakovae]